MKYDPQEPMDPREYLREILINRKAFEAMIQEHRALAAKHDPDFQRFMERCMR